MDGNKPRIYWDTNIFLAWLKNEKREDPADMQGVMEAVRLFDTGKMIVVTSVVTIVEVLQTDLSPEVATKFESITQQRPNDLYMANVDPKIARLAQEIRSYYKNIQEDPNQALLTTPDAIHLSTAILLGCPSFYTFDGSNPNKKRGLPLLPLSGQIAGQYDLQVIKPPVPSQNSLPYDAEGIPKRPIGDLEDDPQAVKET
jgi:predicted nucleic acid-binding protein